MEVLIEPGISVRKKNEVILGAPAADGIRRGSMFLPSQAGDQRDLSQLYLTRIVTPPGNKTGWHHHGQCEIVAYVISGRSHFFWGIDGKQEAILEPGDSFRVAPGAIHAEQTLGDEDFVLVAARCGPGMSILVDGPET